MNKAVSPAAGGGAVAPGPKGHPLLGMLPEFRGDRLGFLVRTARDYGGVARFPIRGRSVFLVTDPVSVKRVLQDNADNYGRKTRSVAALRDTLGNGLLTTTGPSWWRNRRLEVARGTRTSRAPAPTTRDRSIPRRRPPSLEGPRAASGWP